MDTHKEVQEDELMSLMAIYGDDCRDVRAGGPWKVWKPPEIQVRLEPTAGATEGEQSHVAVTIVFRLTHDYPHNRHPHISLSDEKGLSKRELDQLRSLLNEKCKALTGQVMLFELCEATKEFLGERNHPPEYRSFYDGMLKSNRKNLEEQNRQRANSVRKEREEIEAELARRANRTTQQLILQQTSQTPAMTIPRHSELESPMNSPQRSAMLGGGGATKTFTFCDGSERTVRRCDAAAGTSRDSLCDVCHEWLGIVDDQTSDRLVFVTEWTVAMRSKSKGKQPDFGQLERNLSGIEKEFQSLAKLNHFAFFPYLAYKQELVSSGRNHQQKIWIVRKHFEGAVVGSSNFTTSTRLSVGDLRRLSGDILSALSYLHAKGILHRDIRPDCLWRLPNGHFMLSDFSLRNRLLTTITQFLDAIGSKVNIGAQFGSVAGAGKQSQRSDMFMFGLSALSVSAGEWLGSPDTIPAAVKWCNDDALVSFLDSCLSRAVAESITASQLLHHPFLLATDQSLSISVEHDGDFLRKNDPITSATQLQELMALNLQSSRLQNEFVITRNLGKGGFGDVLQVRNKLDGREYAIKRISLNPKNAQLNRKIVREVKLLSRLSHENVVRYYNSWYEFTKLNTTATSAEGDVSDSQSMLPSNLKNAEMAAAGDVSGSVEWSVSYSTYQRHRPPVIKSKFLAGTTSDDSDDADSSEDDEQAEDILGNSFWRNLDQDDDDDIVFERDSTEEPSSVDEPSSGNVDDVSSTDDGGGGAVLQMLYIQMEYCEKSTLRTLINSRELVTDHRRAWRLFRETLEGVKYIHSQGMIHRDIKPDNIFLDSQDHAKIGDFGLATRSLLGDGWFEMTVMDGSAEANVTPLGLLSGGGGSALTTAVGTSFYVSPELRDITKSGEKSKYSNLVDIYSCGVVLFEMFYCRVPVGMERERLMGDLCAHGNIPIDFYTELPDETATRLKTLFAECLCHQPERRPSAKQLLQSDRLPPHDMLETEFQTAFRNSIAHEHSRDFRWIVEQLFSRGVSSALDYVYDRERLKDSIPLLRSTVLSVCARRMEDVFQLYGAIRLDTYNFLTDHHRALRRRRHNAVTLLDADGLTLVAPFDSRYSFARYLARNATSVVRLKRYSFGHVYRRAPLGGQPLILRECSVDIVAETPSTAAAELLAAVCDAVRALVVGGLVAQQHYVLRLGHAGLFRTICLYSGVLQEQLEQVMAVFDETSEDDDSDTLSLRKKRSQRLVQCGLRESIAGNLLNILEVEGPFSKVKSVLRPLIKGKHDSSKEALEALRELEKILDALANLTGWIGKPDNVPFIEIIVSAGLVYRPEVYWSGFLFQLAFVKAMKKDKRVINRVLPIAAGGRYDAWVDLLRVSTVDRPPDSPVTVVGASLSMDRLVSLCFTKQSATATADGHRRRGDTATALGVVSCAAVKTACRILVCSVGGKHLLKRKLGLVRTLRADGIGCDFIENPVDDLIAFQEDSGQRGIDQLLVLKDAEPSAVRLKSLGGARCWTERRIELDALRLTPVDSGADGWRTVIAAAVTADDAAAVANTTGGEDQTPTTIVTSTKTSAAVGGPSCATMANVNIILLASGSGKRLEYNTKKKNEAQMAAALSGLLQKLSPKLTIDLLVATTLPTAVVAAVAGAFDMRAMRPYDEQQFARTADELLATFGGKHRRELASLLDELRDLLVETDVAELSKRVVIVYTLHEDAYRMIA